MGCSFYMIFQPKAILKFKKKIIVDIKQKVVVWTAHYLSKRHIGYKYTIYKKV